MRKARQKSSWPTRKLAFGSGAAAIIGTQVSPAIAEVWPQLVPGFLAGPAVTEIVAALVALVAGLAVGYPVADAPNEVVE